jgi:hypothetical protein
MELQKMKIQIDWETDGQSVNLPETLLVPDMPKDEIADYLSDNYGFLVNNISILEEK